MQTLLIIRKLNFSLKNNTICNPVKAAIQHQQNVLLAKKCPEI